MNYITQAREAITNYSVISGVSLVDFQDILAVLTGPRTTPEITAKLTAIGVKDLVNMTIPEFNSIGLTKTQAQNLHAACLLANALKRVGREGAKQKIRSPLEAAQYVMPELSSLKQEHFMVLYLNVKNEVIHKETVFTGSLNASIVHPREIFRTAVKHSSASVMCFHNHPSGNPAPSQEDISVTKRLQEAGDLLGVELLDHIIIGDNQHVSLKEKGFM